MFYFVMPKKKRLRQLLDRFLWQRLKEVCWHLSALHFLPLAHASEFYMQPT